MLGVVLYAVLYDVLCVAVCCSVCCAVCCTVLCDVLYVCAVCCEKVRVRCSVLAAALMFLMRKREAKEWKAERKCNCRCLGVLW